MIPWRISTNLVSFKTDSQDCTAISITYVKKRDTTRGSKFLAIFLRSLVPRKSTITIALQRLSLNNVMKMQIKMEIKMMKTLLRKKLKNTGKYTISLMGGLTLLILEI